MYIRHLHYKSLLKYPYYLKEDIIPAIESSHALAYAMKLAPTLSKDQIMIVTLSGRGDKDVRSIAKYLEVEIDE